MRFQGVYRPFVAACPWDGRTGRLWGVGGRWLCRLCFGLRRCAHTRHTTMWKAWVGFNASHSYGLILFGTVYGSLALAHSDVLFQSVFLLSLGLLWLFGYVFLA